MTVLLTYNGPFRECYDDYCDYSLMVAPVMCRKMLETCEQLVDIFGACKLVLQIDSLDMFWVLFISANR